MMDHVSGPENAGPENDGQILLQNTAPENDGPRKSEGLKMQNLKMRQFYENALNDHENAFRNITKTHENIDKRKWRL